MAQLQGQVTPRRRWPAEIIGGIVFVVIVIIIGYIWDRQHQPTPTTTVDTAMSVTPDSYNDFIGTVTAVNDASIVVEFKGAAAAGQIFTKNYQVATDASTEIQSLSTVKNERVQAPAKLSDIKIGQTVFAAAADNIAETSSFTATKIYIYQASS